MLTDIMMAAVLSQNKYHRGLCTAMLAGLCAMILRKALLAMSYSGLEAAVLYLLVMDNIRRFCCQQILLGRGIVQAIAGKKIRLLVGVFKQ